MRKIREFWIYNWILVVCLLTGMVSAGSLTIRTTLPPELSNSPRKHGSLYLTDLNYNAVAKNSSTAADQTFTDLPDVPIAIQAFLSIPGYGDLEFTAANGGSGYQPNGQTLDLWYEFARHRFLAAEKMIIESRGSGFEVPQPLQAELEKAQELIQKAQSCAVGSAEQASFALKSLEISCPASEELLIALGKERLDKQGGLRSDQLISTWALAEPGEGQKWWDAAAPLFNGVCPTWYWQEMMQPDGSIDWHYHGYMYKILDGGVDSTDWAATVQRALEKADKSGKAYPDWDQIAQYDRFLAMGKTIHSTPGMWLNCQPLWLKEPTFENLKDISIRFSGALAKQFPKVEYWAVTSETAYSWGNMGFLEPEQIIDITQAACEAIKQVNPQAHCGINNILFVPGDAAVNYGKTSPRTVGTHKFYQMCTEANVPFDFIVLQLYFANRDPFELHQMLEAYKIFGKPIHLELNASSLPAGHPNCKDWPNGHPGQTSYLWRRTWDEPLQADWLEAMFVTCMSMDYIREFSWWDLSDHPYHYYPGGGLLDENYRPKQSYHRLKQIVQRWGKNLKGLGAPQPKQND